MEKLLNTYTIKEVLIFIVLLALAIKGVLTFMDWAIDRLRKVFGKEFQRQTKEQQSEQRIENLEKNYEQLAKSVNTMSEKIDILVQSDRDDIKSFLTEKHHYFCYQQGWIDDYSLECCERRYAHYVEEGGNSFIGGFMDELRALPKLPPKKI